MTLVEGATPPAGFVRLGSTKLPMLNPQGRLIVVDVAIYVKQ